uniref:Uncharacterized protein n=1 Tax=Anguilla anguilla TaxID=7936 RepID=A0A0E9UNG3_ANGAN
MNSQSYGSGCTEGVGHVGRFAMRKAKAQWKTFIHKLWYTTESRSLKQ